jgi:hypothetical protein
MIITRGTSWLWSASFIGERVAARPPHRYFERATSIIFKTKVAKPITIMVISSAVFVSIVITSFCGMISALCRCRAIALNTKAVDY